MSLGSDEAAARRTAGDAAAIGGDRRFDDPVERLAIRLEAARRAGAARYIFSDGDCINDAVSVTIAAHRGGRGQLAAHLGAAVLE